MSSTSGIPCLQYVNTNHVPSDDEVGEIRAFVQVQQKLMDVIDKEIDVLIKRREEKSRLVEEYSALLSPARRIPAEVLSAIFFASLPRNSPTRRRTVLSKYHPAVVVSHVCQSWRQVALNTPLLWTVIDIDVPKYPAAHESRLEGVVDWWESQLQAINEMTMAWILRSAGESLTISFTGGLNIENPYILEKDTVSRANESVARIVDAMCSVSNRWRAAHLSLEFTDETSPLCQLFHLTSDNLTLLESLSINVFMVACPNLTRCTLELPSAESIPETPDTEISLPHLRTLELWGAEPPRVFASRLHLPSLRQLTLICQPPSNCMGYQGGATDLIQKFGEGLSDVTFDSRGFTESSLTRVLSFLPNIVTLRLVEGAQHSIYPFQIPVIFDSTLDELGRRDGEQGLRLCPKLEKLGFRMTARSVFSQAALVRFIASRRPSLHTQPKNRQTNEVEIQTVVVAFSTRRFTRATRGILEEMGVDLEDMTLITTYQGEVTDTLVSTTQVPIDDLYDNDDYASTAGRRRRTLDGWFL
ncbi:hypothetical protein MD484_g5482, partial [Candolleomyces efflorescens]